MTVHLAFLGASSANASPGSAVSSAAAGTAAASNTRERRRDECFMRGGTCLLKKLQHESQKQRARRCDAQARGERLRARRSMPMRSRLMTSNVGPLDELASPTLQPPFLPLSPLLGASPGMTMV